MVITGLITYIEYINTPKEPKFYKTQLVEYKVPLFYKYVCNGKGEIKDYRQFERTYLISTESGCPDFWIKEEDISK